MLKRITSEIRWTSVKFADVSCGLAVVGMTAGIGPAGASVCVGLIRGRRPERISVEIVLVPGYRARRHGTSSVGRPNAGYAISNSGVRIMYIMSNSTRPRDVCSRITPDDEIPGTPSIRLRYGRQEFFKPASRDCAFTKRAGREPRYRVLGGGSMAPRESPASLDAFVLRRRLRSEA